MKPFFKYFGSKYRMARYYGWPQYDTVIEPFAGSACYSVYWEPKNVLLYDKDENVCDMWDYLINCSIDDIKKLPDWIESMEQIFEYSNAEQHLLCRYIYQSPGKNIPKKSNLGFYKRFVAVNRDGYPDPDNKYTNRTEWSPKIKDKLINQKSLIKNWKVQNVSYENIPDTKAHWFIDPPYNNSNLADKYVHSYKDIDYTHLAKWCASRTGYVSVCEKGGATWLPFTELKVNSNQHNNKYTEVVWTKTKDD